MEPNNEYPDSNKYIDQEGFLGNPFAFEDELNSQDILANVMPENIAVSSYLEVEPVYRSAALMAPSPFMPVAFNVGGAYNPDAEDFQMMGPPVLKKESNVKGPATDFLPYESQYGYGNGVVPPEVPFLLMQTHFETGMSIDDILVSTTEFLSELQGGSFEFNSSCCEWSAIIVNGSCNCKFQIHVYDNQKNRNYIVEANRLSGDASCFHSTFASLKSRMTPSDKVEMRDMDSFATSMPLQSAQGMGIQCSAAEAREGLQCILNMAKEPNTTSNLEACKILCDFTQDDSLVQAICDCGAVEILGGFLSAPCEWTKQHAIVAIANLSDKAICQEAIINAGVLPTLLSLATDGPYQSSELRRMAVFILANVSATFSSRVVHALGRKEVACWIDSVEGLRDERLKLHAVRAKEILSKEPALLSVK